MSDVTEYSDGEMTAYALNMWANHIETGNVSMSAVDAINQNKQKCVKGLNLTQQKFVVRLGEKALEVII